MIKQTTRLEFKMQSQDCDLSLTTGDVIVTDSESRDSLTITGITRKTLELEIRSYVRCLRWSHDKGKRQEAIDWLAELVSDADRCIASIRADMEEAAK
jgi:hypothetical protein